MTDTRSLFFSFACIASKWFGSIQQQLVAQVPDQPVVILDAEETRSLIIRQLAQQGVSNSTAVQCATWASLCTIIGAVEKAQEKGTVILSSFFGLDAVLHAHADDDTLEPLLHTQKALVNALSKAGITPPTYIIDTHDPQIQLIRHYLTEIPGQQVPICFDSTSANPTQDILGQILERLGNESTELAVAAD